MVEFKRSLAIIIGINQYQHGIKFLETAKYDAEKLAQILGDKNRQDYYEVTLITDDTDIKPTGKNILDFLTKTLIEENLTQRDRLLFYFAGHGIARTNENDKEFYGPQGFLVPSDAHYNEPESLIPMREVYESLAQLKCWHLLVILDCCFAGAFRWASTFRSHYTPKKITKAHYQRFTKFQAWQVITSSAYNQEALDFVDNRGKDNTEDKHSPFAQALFQGLKGEADLDNDGVIVTPELYLYTRKYVEEHSQEKQTPGFFPLQKHDRGEYIFRIPNRELNLAETPPLNPDNNPYRGLEPFEEKHSRFFFGRQELITELAQRINHEDHRLTVVLGASGSGKSSLVKAGLIPHLRQGKEHQWQIIASMRPGEYPFTALAKSLWPISGYLSISEVTSLDFIDKSLTNYLSHNEKKEINEENRITTLQENWSDSSFWGKLLLINNRFSDFKKVCKNAKEESQLTDLRQRIHKSLQQLIDNLSSNPQKLIDIINNWTQTHPQTQLLLVIDQFEELITLTREIDTKTNPETEKIWESFINLLANTLNRCSQFHVIVTLRSDFETRFLDSALNPYWTKSRFTVRPMSSSELREAIEKPALERALYFQPANLVYRLIDEVGQMPGALPLLSFTLSELYLKLARKWQKEETQDRALTIDEEFDSQGGVAGALTNRANKEYDDLQDEKLQTTMRRVMLRMLTVEGWEVARRQVPDSELVYTNEEKNERVKLVIEKLVNVRLVVKGQGMEEAYVEPAHDYLVKGWDKLQDWIKEYREDLTLQQRLTPGANDWRINGSPKDNYLLPDDDRLNQLEKILAQENNWLNKQETNFIQASLEKRDFENRKAKEQQTRTELLRQVDRIENVIRVESEQGLLLAIQTIGKNLELIPNEIITSIQHCLHQALEFGQVTIKSFSHPTETPKFVAFRPDREMIATVNYGGDGLLWDMNGNLVGKPFDGNHYVAFTSVNRIISIRSGKIQLWDIEGNTIEQNFEDDEDDDFRIGNISYSSASNMIVSGWKNGSIRLWNIRGELICQSTQFHQEGDVNCLAFSPNGQIIASGNSGVDVSAEIILWNLQGEPIRESFKGHQNSSMLTAIAFSPDNQLIVSGCNGGKVLLWDMKGNIIAQPSFGLDGSISSLAFSPNGLKIAIGTLANAWHLWDVQSYILSPQFKTYQSRVECVAFSPDGQILATCGDNTDERKIRFWDVRSSQITELLSESEYRVNSVVFSPDGQYIVGGDDGGMLILWDIEKNKIGQLFGGHGASVNSVAFSPDGKYIISASGLMIMDGRDCSIRLWNIKGESIGKPFQGHSEPINAIAMSPDGKTIVSGSDDNTVRLWDINGNPIGQAFRGHESSVKSVAFSPCGQMIASASWDNTVRLCDINGNPIGQAFRGHEEFVVTVAFSPCGQMIASGSYDGTVRLWNIEGKLIGEPFQGDMGSVFSLTFSPDGKTITTGSRDQTVRLWDLNGNPICPPLRGHKSSVKSVAFSPDGKMIISSGDDGTVRLWRGSWRTWLEVCCDRLYHHPVSKNPVTEEEKQACQTCYDYVWHPEIGAKKLYQKGKKRFEEESYKEALSIFNLVIQFNSNHTDAHHYRDKCWEYLNSQNNTND